MTLREYIEELGFDDYEHFFEMELTSLVLMPLGRSIPAHHYSSFLDYDIEEIEHHIELEEAVSARMTSVLNTTSSLFTARKTANDSSSNHVLLGTFHVFLLLGRAETRAEFKP